MARNLVQALEGIQFPCDRARVIEYARRNEVSVRSLDTLQALPDGRQFKDMTELFSALPSQNEVSRRRATVVRMPPREQEEATQQPKPTQAQPKPAPSQAKTDQFTEKAEPPPVAAPLQDAPQAGSDMMDPTLQWWRWSMELWQRMWFPWLR